MNYETVFKAAESRTVRAAISGAGEFGTSFIFQSRRVRGLEVAAIYNRTVEKGVRAFVHAGIPAENVKICGTAGTVVTALEAGQYVVVGDPSLLIGAGLDIFIEGTGHPETGARIAEMAIKDGMHVAMVSKEPDSVVGPILNDKARKAGLVYTPVDGDQPSLLIRLISWARVLGLNILAAGKSSEYDFIFDPDTGRVTSLEKSTTVPEFGTLWNVGKRGVINTIGDRSEMLLDLPQHAVPDLCEMGLVANATGMCPDLPDFHAPICRIPEIPDIMCPREFGGILSGTGVLDVINLLRKPDEVSLAGGVFIIVECEDQKTWEVLRLKGHVVSQNRRTVMLYHPAHLLGVESAISVLSAALLGQSTGGEHVRPVCDLVGRATKDLKAGAVLEAVGHHHTIDGVEGLLVESCAAVGSGPAPYYLMSGCKLIRDVPTGTILPCEALDIPAESTMWRLRAEQDATFLSGAKSAA